VGHEQVAGRTRRYYQLTDRGIQLLQQEAARMEQAARIVTGRHDLPAVGPQPA
jgi:DNA-binding PadR family transcriptional regulator